jgi:hypothetical protein
MRTVNVGTNTSGNAIISLFSDYDGTTDSGNPYIGIGATSFGAAGVWQGFEGGSAGSAGTAKFYVGDGSNDYLKYDGTNLSFKGANAELTTAGAFTATAGTIAGWTFASGTTALYNGRSALDTGTGIYLGTDGIAMGATADPAEFSVLESGAMHAESGDIAGWDFDTEKLKKEHATAAYKMEFDTNATIVQTDEDIDLHNAYWSDNGTTVNYTAVGSTGALVGHYIYGHSTIPYGTTVLTNVNPYTITISNAATGAAVGVSIKAQTRDDTTGVQALTMVSGSDADWDSGTAETPLVQISNIENFVDEGKSYILGRDKSTIESNFEEEDFEHTSDLFAGGFTE